MSTGAMFFSSWLWNIGLVYPLHRVPEGSWYFAQPVYMCSVDLEKAFSHLWGDYGVPDFLIQTVCTVSQSAIRQIQ